MTAIDGATIFLTGANRGLGHALSKAFLAAGAHRLYAAVRRPADLDFDDSRIVPVALDVTDRDSIRAAVAAAPDMTILVNNAGINRFGSALAAPDADIAAEFAVNVFGPLDLIRAFAPTLSRNSGAVVNILSICSLAAMPGLAGYSASKAAMHSLHQSLVPALRAQGIGSHAAFPGPMDTAMNDGRQRHTFPPPASIAAAIVAGILRDEAEIFPDARSRDVGTLWSTSPAALQREFAGF